ncbi:MAG: alpha/beta hydrolase [Actinomycetota bacterium]|nr:alpha/beta hydrolase [Actinomycetota bacterium]
MANSHVRTGTGDHGVVALHGWFGSANGWGALPDYLDGRRFSYAFMDLRGYGDSRDVVGDHTMEEVARDTVALADQLGWDTFSVVGHSMSGKAAQRVLVEAPDRVRKLVVMNSVPANGFPFDDEGWGLFAGAAENRDNRYAIIDFTTGNRLTPTFVNLVTQHSLDNSTVEAFGGYLEPWGKGDFSDEIKGNETPIKVIVGEHDPALSAALMEQTLMQWYPNAELEVLPNAGHYPMHETPVALATTVEEFLSR